MARSAMLARLAILAVAAAFSYAGWSGSENRMSADDGTRPVQESSSLAPSYLSAGLLLLGVGLIRRRPSPPSV
jgi:hypothetical protein